MDTMDTEKLFSVNTLQNKIEEIESNLKFIDAQVEELETFLLTIKELDLFSQKDILASLGKGVFVKSSLTEKKLLVNVGSNIVIEKTPSQVQSDIHFQVKKLKEARISLLGDLDASRNEILSLIEEIEKTKQ